MQFTFCQNRHFRQNRHSIFFVSRFGLVLHDQTKIKNMQHFYSVEMPFNLQVINDLSIAYLLT